MKKFIAFLLCSLCVCIAHAQNNTDSGFMRSNGKLYVVVAVVATILTGMFIYLIKP